MSYQSYTSCNRNFPHILIDARFLIESKFHVQNSYWIWGPKYQKYIFFLRSKWPTLINLFYKFFVIFDCVDEGQIASKYLPWLVDLNIKMHFLAFLNLCCLLITRLFRIFWTPSTWYTWCRPFLALKSLHLSQNNL